MPRCKECKEKFESKYFNQKFCMDKDECIKAHVEFSKAQHAKKKKNDWEERKKVIKEKIKTRSDHLKEAQKEFNRYIRLRDKDEPCISCRKPLRHGNIDASHFYSVGGYPRLRFNEDNCHSACVYCNRYLHGNISEYTIRLPKKIGLDRFEQLHRERNLEPLKLTIEEIKDIKEKYKNKCK